MADLRQRAAYEAAETGCKIDCYAHGEDVYPEGFGELTGTQVYAANELIGTESPIDETEHPEILRTRRNFAESAQRIRTEAVEAALDTLKNAMMNGLVAHATRV